jgi:hypothetical protein
MLRMQKHSPYGILHKIPLRTIRRRYGQPSLRETLDFALRLNLNFLVADDVFQHFGYVSWTCARQKPTIDVYVRPSRHDVELIRAQHHGGRASAPDYGICCAFRAEGESKNRVEL